MAEPVEVELVVLTDAERRAVHQGFDNALNEEMNEAHLYHSGQQVVAARVAAAKAEALNAAAEAVERELICCDVFERLHNRPPHTWTAEEHSEHRRHAICYWSDAARRLVLEERARPQAGETEKAIEALAWTLSEEGVHDHVMGASWMGWPDPEDEAQMREATERGLNNARERARRYAAILRQVST